MCMFYVYSTPTFVHTLLQLFLRLLSVLYIARIAVLLVGFGSLWHQFCNKLGTYFQMNHSVLIVSSSVLLITNHLLYSNRATSYSKDYWCSLCIISGVRC